MAAVDPWATHRQERWEWRLYTFTEAPAGTLDGVETGTLELNRNATIKGAGSLTWSGPFDAQPDWQRCRIQPVYILTTADGEDIETPWGLYIPAAPSRSYADTQLTVDVELYDKTSLLDGDEIDETYTIEAGQPVVPAVRALVTSADPAARTLIADSNKVQATTASWPAGTKKLTIINELLDSLNYFSIWCDGDGTYRADPRKGPRERAVSRVFRDGPDSIYSPNFTHGLDTFSVPNKVVLVARSNGEEPALTASATNENPDSPTSYQARGNRWITRTERDIEAVDEETLQALAQHRLEELSQIAQTIDFEHAIVPLPFYNAIVEFRRDAADISVLAVIQSMSISTELGADVRTNLRQVL